MVGFRVDRLFTGLCCGQGHLLIILISILAGASANVCLVCYYVVEITRCSLSVRRMICAYNVR